MPPKSMALPSPKSMRTFCGAEPVAGVTVKANVVVAAGPLVGVAVIATDGAGPTVTPMDEVDASPSAVEVTVIVKLPAEL